jgi:adenylate cyclase
MRGSIETGIPMIRRALDDLENAGSISYRTYHLGLLAEALMLAGNLNESYSVLNEAIQLVERTNERLWAAELERWRGELLLRGAEDGSTAGAEECFQRALAISRDQGSKMLELRALTSLARLHQGTPRFTDLVAELRAIHDQFAEGIQCADLADAAEMFAS